jgi:hypothetical protein
MNNPTITFRKIAYEQLYDDLEEDVKILKEFGIASAAFDIIMQSQIDTLQKIVIKWLLTFEPENENDEMAFVARIVKQLGRVLEEDMK